tara:strand:+ start:2086 stop:2286 length:201 start_codon:yes stop_codon:yes gene_type:complete
LEKELEDVLRVLLDASLNFPMIFIMMSEKNKEIFQYQYPLKTKWNMENIKFKQKQIQLMQFVAFKI